VQAAAHGTCTNFRLVPIIFVVENLGLVVEKWGVVADFVDSITH
jgi:hypothetical protein